MSLGSLPVTARAQTFQWPVPGGILTQDYAEFGPQFPNKNRYHAGFDIGGVDAGTPVVAAAAGKVRRLDIGVIPPDNHCMGNVVIIDHSSGTNPKGPFSLYAHLKRITVADGVNVSQGDQIGEVGNTGGGGRPDCPSFPAHLHFEVKENNTLGDFGDDGVENYGYTQPDPPNQHGYLDPIRFLHLITPFGPTPLEVTSGESGCVVNPDPLNVRAGPSTTYEIMTSIVVGRQFVAFSRSGDWYQIHLPVPWKSTGVIDGWVNRCYVKEIPTANQVEIRNTGAGGLNVRSDHRVITSPSNNSVGKVWDGQKFVTFGTPTPGTGCEGVYRWRQIYLSQNAGAQSGWVCDKWAQPLSGSPPPSSPPVSPVTLQGQAVPGITNGEFLGFGGSRLNNNGDVIFGADVDTDDDGLSNRSGFFKDSQGTKSKIVATGESTATSIGSLNFLYVGSRPAPINDDGNMVFEGVWDEADGRHNGNFLASNGSITKLFESGEQVTVRRGTGTFNEVRAGPINNQGDIAFTASVVVNNFAAPHIFLAPSGCRQPSCLVEIAAGGEATGVTGIGGTLDSGGLIGTHLSLTSDGDVVFRALINGGDTTVAYLLYDRDTGLKKKVVAAGDVAPSGRIFNGVSSEHVAPNGRMVFLGKFPDPSPTSQGVYYISSVSAPFPQMKKVVEEGDQLLGASDTFTLFSTGTTRASVNSDGSVAFNAKFFPVGSPLEKIDGVFVWTGGKFVQIALEGECTPAGGTYGGASDPHLNDSGKVVFFNPRVGPSSGCPPLAVGTSSSPTKVFGLVSIDKLIGIFLPSPAQAQATDSNVGAFTTVSPLDLDPELFRLTVSTEGTGSGIVTSSPEGIDCGTTCQASFDSGTEVTLTATPSIGSIFGGWSGNPDCSDGQVTMDADKTCTATFIQQFTFGASGGTGSVNVTVPDGQSWTAVSNVPWIKITSGSSGTGNGIVNYSVAANTSATPRNGTLTIAGQTFTVQQNGSCLYSGSIIRVTVAPGNSPSTIYFRLSALSPVFFSSTTSDAKLINAALHALRRQTKITVAGTAAVCPAATAGGNIGTMNFLIVNP